MHNDVGQRLLQLRKDKKITLQEVENATDIHRAVLSRYETNQRKPKAEYLQKLADFYGVSVSWLITGIDETKMHCTAIQNAHTWQEMLDINVDEKGKYILNTLYSFEKEFSIFNFNNERTDFFYNHFHSMDILPSRSAIAVCYRYGYLYSEDIELLIKEQCGFYLYIDFYLSRVSTLSSLPPDFPKESYQRIENYHLEQEKKANFFYNLVAFFDEISIYTD